MANSQLDGLRGPMRNLSVVDGNLGLMSTVCECGCGLPAPIAKDTNRNKGHIKGQPVRYRKGHWLRVNRIEASLPFSDRYAARVQIGDLDECWPWIGYRTNDGDGYGQVMLNGVRMQVSVATYLHFNGPIPAGEVVRHTCDYPPCCNPTHLITGTYEDNSRDMVERGRSKAAKLSDDQVREIRAAIADGHTTRAVADQFGIHNSCVSRVANRKSYRHV